MPDHPEEAAYWSSPGGAEVTEGRRRAGGFVQVSENNDLGWKPTLPLTDQNFL